MHTGGQNLGQIPRRRQACRCERSPHRQEAGEWPGLRIIPPVVRDDEDVAVGKACSVVEERKVISQVERRGLLFEGIGGLAREIIDEGYDDARVIS
eukprot:6210405-Pleurochrysis_carterae.AAC.1